MKVINLYGGPSSGKSTTAAGLFYFMKLRGLNVELVTEYAKSLLWSKRLDHMQDQQEYMFAKQHHMIHRLRGHVDYAVVDSPLLFSIVYPKINRKLNNVAEWPALAAFMNLVESVYHTYDNIDILLARPEAYQETGRRQDIEGAKLIDDMTYEVLTTVGTEYYNVPTNEQTVQTILDIIGVDK